MNPGEEMTHAKTHNRTGKRKRGDILHELWLSGALQQRVCGVQEKEVKLVRWAWDQIMPTLKASEDTGASTIGFCIGREREHSH